MIGPFGVGRGRDWVGSCEGPGVSLRLGAVVTLSFPGAVAVPTQGGGLRRCGRAERLDLASRFFKDPPGAMIAVQIARNPR